MHDPITAGAYHLSSLASGLRRQAEAARVRGFDAVALQGAADAAEIASAAVLVCAQAAATREEREIQRAARWAAFAALGGGLVGGVVAGLLARL
jgi:hypothetical protein